MKPFEIKVNSQYGAPMGARSSKLADLIGKVHLQKVPLYDGDYDKGGVYWGGGRGTLPLYCAWDDEGSVYYLRAASRAAAAREIIAGLQDGAKLYRK